MQCEQRIAVGHHNPHHTVSFCILWKSALDKKHIQYICAPFFCDCHNEIGSGYASEKEVNRKVLCIATFVCDTNIQTKMIFVRFVVADIGDWWKWIKKQAFVWHHCLLILCIYFIFVHRRISIAASFDVWSIKRMVAFPLFSLITLILDRK